MNNKFENTNESIDLISDKVYKYILKSGLSKREALSYKLSIENCLIDWNRDLDNSYFILEISSSMGQHNITIKTDGKSLNPIVANIEGDVSRSLYKGLGIYPEYEYEDNLNSLTFTYQKRSSNKLLKICIAAIIGIVISTLIKLFIPSNYLDILYNSIILPIYNTFFRMLNCISGPLVFLSVIWGIYGIGDSATFSKTSKKIILPFLVGLIVASFFALFSFPLFNVIGDSDVTNLSQLSKIFEMLLNIVPSNILSPFSDGNTLQIIYIAIIMGFAMLFLGQRVSIVSELVDQINVLVSYCMGLISDMIPYFISLVIIKIVLSNSLSFIKTFWKLALFYIIAVIIFSFVNTLIVVIKNKVKFSTLIKKSIPTFIIAVTTASSAAAFESNVSTCTEKFGISRTLTSFGIPLGMVMFKSTTVIYYVMLSFYFSSLYGISCSLSWIFICGLTSVILSIATPPIPGGGAAAYAVLMMQLGLPDEALALALSVDIMFDFLRTAANMYNLPIFLINRALSLNQLDKNILRSDA